MELSERKWDWLLWLMAHSSWLIAVLGLATTGYAVQEQTPTGVRPIGMAETFVGLVDDENSVRWNPAGLSRLNRYAVGFEQTSAGAFGVLDTSYLSAAIPASSRMAFGFDWLQVGVTDAELDAKRHSFNFAYSYLPFSLLSVGLNLKYFTWSTALDGRSLGNATGWGTDIGLLASPNHQWAIGVLAENFAGFGAGKGLSRDTWIRHDTGVSERVFPTAYKLGVIYRPTPRWLFATDITDRLHVGAEVRPNANLALRLGLEKDLRTSESPTFALGGSVKYRWLQLNLAYLVPPTLPTTLYAGLTLNFNFRKLPVQIEHARIRDLYPVHYNFYATPNRDAEEIVLERAVRLPVYTDADRDRYYPLDPQDRIGRIWLKNESREPISVRVEVFIEDFVGKDGTEVASVTIPSGARMAIPMRQLVLSKRALSLSQTQPVEARVRVVESGGTAYRTTTETVILHGIRETRLDDVGKLASFISSSDPAIRSFVNRIHSAFSEEISQSGIPSRLYVAMLLFNALAGVSYAPDPNIPRASGTIEEIKHPHEMLEQLMGQLLRNDAPQTFGDCDDSTALYCSLLESFGIQTALIQLPNHVLMAFRLDYTLDDAEQMRLPNAYYLPINGRVWIPVETTRIADGFAEAWRTASQTLQLEGVRQIVPVEEAWEKYGQSYLQGTASTFRVPKARIEAQMNKDMADSWLTGFLEKLQLLFER